MFGFSLIELLVAILILSITTLGTLKLQSFLLAVIPAKAGIHMPENQDSTLTYG